MTLLAVAVGDRGLVDPGEPVLRADDEALLRGRAAFETVRVYRGRSYRLSEHLARLGRSAERIGLPTVNARQLEALADQAIEAAGGGDAVLRLFWTPGNGEGSPTSLALVSELPTHYDALRERGQRLITLRGIRAEEPWLLPGVKSTSYAVNMAAEAEARRRGADDALFVDHEGVVLEGPTTNIWWRRDRTLYTPQLELGILAGVTRAVVLDLAVVLAYEVVEGVFPLSDLTSADEAFTSSSIREVMPVTELDERPLRRGPAADELQAMLHEEATQS
ncbi:MAG: aminotransferase class IV [Actinobacteria bacterium]|nr:aminotransferase class IV [Actinomycetota bacterium]